MATEARLTDIVDKLERIARALENIANNLSRIARRGIPR